MLLFNTILLDPSAPGWAKTLIRDVLTVIDPVDAVNTLEVLAEAAGNELDVLRASQREIAAADRKLRGELEQISDPRLRKEVLDAMS